MDLARLAHESIAVFTRLKPLGLGKLMPPHHRSRVLGLISVVRSHAGLVLGIL